MVVVISTLGIRKESFSEGNGQGKLQRKGELWVESQGTVRIWKQGASNKGILDDGQIHILYIYAK